MGEGCCAQLHGGAKQAEVHVLACMCLGRLVTQCSAAAARRLYILNFQLTVPYIRLVLTLHVFRLSSRIIAILSCISIFLGFCSLSCDLSGALIFNEVQGGRHCQWA